jgi:hypothetical protein
MGRFCFFAALLRGDLYVAFLAPGSAARFTNQFASTEAFVALTRHDAATVANVAFHNSLFGGELSCAFAFVTF